MVGTQEATATSSRYKGVLWGILKRVPICTRLGSRGFIPMFVQIAWELAFQLPVQFLSQVSSAKPATL
jgi:hypothetical protein